MTAITAVILSGGFSTRMNRNNKAFLKIRGINMIEIIINQVSVFQETLIVSNSPKDYTQFKIKTVTDIIPQQGPLSGIHSGLVHAIHDRCLVVPCDMPFLKQDLLRYLADQSEDYDVVVPRLNGKYQPLCGVYSKACIEPIQHCLNNDIRKITRLYSMVRVKEITEQDLKTFGNPEEFFRNINDPEEYFKFCL